MTFICLYIFSFLNCPASVLYFLFKERYLIPTLHPLCSYQQNHLLIPYDVLILFYYSLKHKNMYINLVMTLSMSQNLSLFTLLYLCAQCDSISYSGKDLLSQHPIPDAISLHHKMYLIPFYCTLKPYLSRGSWHSHYISVGAERRLLEFSV